MSFEDINIVRGFNVVNGFVQLPNNLERDKSAYGVQELLDTFPQFEQKQFHPNVGTHKTAGPRGRQHWVNIPAYNPHRDSPDLGTPAIQNDISDKIDKQMR